MTYELIIDKVALELDLPPQLVKNTYKAYWQFIKDTILALPLKEDIEDEEFFKLKTNFNVPSLGKLVCTIDRYKNVKKRFAYILNLKDKNNVKDKEHTSDMDKDNNYSQLV